MAFVYFNPNPSRQSVGDCVVRGLCILLNDSWENVYADIAMQGRLIYDMPDANNVWGTYLSVNGFTKHVIPNTCPHCYTVRDFCRDHPYGKYLLATGKHVIAVVNGDYYDTTNTGDEVPVYYWRKER